MALPRRRRTFWRVALAPAVLVGLIGVAGVGAVRAYGTLCAGPVDTYPALAAARDSAAQEASSAPAASAPAAAAGMQARVLQLVLDVKQSDYVAFPAHMLAGLALERGGCPVGATGDQWRKAAGHAWADWPARVAAAGLARTAGAARGPVQTAAELQAYASAEPWHADNLQRVAVLYATLDARKR